MEPTWEDVGKAILSLFLSLFATFGILIGMIFLLFLINIPFAKMDKKIEETRNEQTIEKLHGQGMEGDLYTLYHREGGSFSSTLSFSFCAESAEKEGETIIYHMSDGGKIELTIPTKKAVWSHGDGSIELFENVIIKKVEIE